MAPPSRHLLSFSFCHDKLRGALFAPTIIFFVTNSVAPSSLFRTNIHLLNEKLRGTFFAPPAPGRVTIDAVENVPDAFWLAVGYRRLGGRVMRVDMVERVAMLVRTAARDGAFKITEEMLSLAGATREQMAAMLRGEQNILSK